MTKTRLFDAARYLDTDEAVALFIAEALADGDAGFIADAFGIAARAKGMTQIAKSAGLSRENLYKALSAEGNPELSTLLGVVKALGLELSVAPVRKTDATNKGRTAPRRRRTAKATEAA